MAKTKEVEKSDKNYSTCFTVGQLIEELKKYPKDRKVRYTLGGSVDFGNITYVNGTSPYGEPYVIIGGLSW